MNDIRHIIVDPRDHAIHEVKGPINIDSLRQTLGGAGCIVATTLSDGREIAIIERAMFDATAPLVRIKGSKKDTFRGTIVVVGLVHEGEDKPFTMRMSDCPISFDEAKELVQWLPNIDLDPNAG